MKINIGQDLYEIDNQQANEIFNHSKTFAHEVLNHCEGHGMSLKELTYHLISCACHFNHLVQKTIDSMGEEKFIKMVEGIKIDSSEILNNK